MHDALKFMPQWNSLHETCQNCGKELFEYSIPAIGVHAIKQTCQCELEREDAKREKDLQRGAELVRQRIREISGMRSKQQEHTFASFDAATTPERKEKIPALTAAKTFAERHIARQGNGILYLYGNVGCGKTHLACAIANEVIDNLQIRDDSAEYAAKYNDVSRITQRMIRVTTSTEMLEAIRKSFNDPENNAQILDACKHARLLVLDDLGAEKPSDWVRERLFELFDYRNAEQLPTVITSNLAPKQIAAQLGDRIADRIRDGAVVVQVPGKSERKPA